eukprot:scaffold27363_cov124-Isochrysis_galbana.AAC.1
MGSLEVGASHSWAVGWAGTGAATSALRQPANHDGPAPQQGLLRRAVLHQAVASSSGPQAPAPVLPQGRLAARAVGRQGDDYSASPPPLPKTLPSHRTAAATDGGGAPGQDGAAGGGRRLRWTVAEEAWLEALVAEEESKIRHEEESKIRQGDESKIRHEARRPGAARGRRAGGSQTQGEMYRLVAERMGGMRSAHACRQRMGRLRGGGGEGLRVVGATAGAQQGARLPPDEGRAACAGHQAVDGIALIPLYILCAAERVARQVTSDGTSAARVHCARTTADRSRAEPMGRRSRRSVGVG